MKFESKMRIKNKQVKTDVGFYGFDTFVRRKMFAKFRRLCDECNAERIGGAGTQRGNRKLCILRVLPNSRMPKHCREKTENVPLVETFCPFGRAFSKSKNKT
jgi:hypothetical protein